MLEGFFKDFFSRLVHRRARVSEAWRTTDFNGDIFCSLDMTDRLHKTTVAL
jgi:hypothetical protein